MKNFVLAALLSLVFAAPSFAAAVTFRGNLTGVFPGAADPLGIGPTTVGSPRAFVGWLNTNATGTSVLNGAISFQTSPNTNFLFSGGTLTTDGAGTHFTGMVLAGAPAGTLMNFDFATQITDFVSQNSVNQLLFTSGSVTLTVGALAQYTGTITAVPEPSTGLILLGCVAGVGLIGRRKKTAAAA